MTLYIPSPSLSSWVFVQRIFPLSCFVCAPVSSMCTVQGDLYILKRKSMLAISLQRSCNWTEGMHVGPNLMAMFACRHNYTFHQDIVRGTCQEPFESTLCQPSSMLFDARHQHCRHPFCRSWTQAWIQRQCLRHSSNIMPRS